MNEILETEVFSEWLRKLKDPVGKVSILRRIKRAREGNFGDHESVGGNVSEMRLFNGPGYRLYYTMIDKQVYWLLIGGDKSTQEKDIEKARKMASGIHGTKP
ncbi:MAG: type II toxin-antitoxin system RelE/ParE family toxin [Alteromonadaceae bacterium]|nr:type II toxin-antitoxin system RelE/ParE family toxin [Alteromonadaceae bacterium]